mmetsp:Transcript_21391/g.85071  ORF Transcript_21391/g.85071 Transcript_21391/m.85071 type:complete len:204 (-) Transcript_21391:586-1197(-)
MTSSLRSSTSSSGPQTMTAVPGTTFSRPWPVILSPTAASMTSCLTSSVLTRVSRDGGGVSSARACVTSGPSGVQSTSASPSRSAPLTRMTSSVAPSPSTTLTSSTVHWSVAHHVSVCARRCCVSESTTRSRSGTPSPVIADVGTIDTVDRGSSFSQYSATLSACSLSSTDAWRSRSRNSCSVCSDCASSASRIDAFSRGVCQS